MLPACWQPAVRASSSAAEIKTGMVHLHSLIAGALIRPQTSKVARAARGGLLPRADVSVLSTPARGAAPHRRPRPPGPHCSSTAPWSVDRGTRPRRSRLSHRDIAREQQTDPRIRLKRLVRQRRVARAEDAVARHVPPQLFLHGILDVDVAQDAEALGLRAAWTRCRAWSNGPAIFDVVSVHG